MSEERVCKSCGRPIHHSQYKEGNGRCHQCQPGYGGHSYTEGSEVKENVFELFVSIYPPFRACFRIGVQTFSVCERVDKKEAEWFVERLRSAFQTLEEYQTDTLKSKLKRKDEEIQQLKEALKELMKVTEQFIDFYPVTARVQKVEGLLKKAKKLI